MNISLAVVKQVLDKARNGVTYQDDIGGVCPYCGRRHCRVYRTLPADGGIRTRYHRCQRCDARFKSIEENLTQGGNHGRA